MDWQSMRAPTTYNKCHVSINCTWKEHLKMRKAHQNKLKWNVCAHWNVMPVANAFLSCVFWYSIITIKCCLRAQLKYLPQNVFSTLKLCSQVNSNLTYWLLSMELLKCNLFIVEPTNLLLKPAKKKQKQNEINLLKMQWICVHLIDLKNINELFYDLCG